MTTETVQTQSSRVKPAERLSNAELLLRYQNPRLAVLHTHQQSRPETVTRPDGTKVTVLPPTNRFMVDTFELAEERALRTDPLKDLPTRQVDDSWLDEFGNSTIDDFQNVQFRRQTYRPQHRTIDRIQQRWQRAWSIEVADATRPPAQWAATDWQPLYRIDRQTGELEPLYSRSGEPLTLFRQALEKRAELSPEPQQEPDEEPDERWGVEILDFRTCDHPDAPYNCSTWFEQVDARDARFERRELRKLIRRDKCLYGDQQSVDPDTGELLPFTC